MSSLSPRPIALAAVVLGAAFVALLDPAWADRTMEARASTPTALAHRPPGARPSETGPSTVVFPVQRIPLNFDHQKHADKLGLACTSCHLRATTSRSSQDNLLAPPSVCDGCHDSDHEKLDAVTPKEGAESCSFCHVGHRPEHGRSVERVVLPAPNIRFDHSVHARRNINCRQCHGEVQRIGLATRDQMPRMRGCLKCHGMPPSSQGDARGECTVCHLTENGRLKTTFPTGDLLPPPWLHGADHGPDWIERHKAVAAANSQFCSSCHAEQECVECHDGRVRPRRIHPNDWLSLHAVASRQDAPRCSTCHRAQSFCIECHQRAGVTWSGPLANTAARGRFHPPRSVWTDRPRTASHHAAEAQRNLDACVSCHSERDCTICHATAAVGGPGVRPTDLSRGESPHPPGFTASCRGPLQKNARPCLVCHLSSDPLLDRCR